MRAEILGDALVQWSASVFSAAVLREKLNLCCRPCMGQNQSAPFELEVGSRQGGPRTPSGWNQLEATLVDELVGMWAGRDPAVVWAPEWKEFEILT